MSKRLVCTCVMLVMFLSFLAGCDGKKLPHNAVFYGDIYQNRTWLQAEFYESNLTSGSWSNVKQEYVSGDAYYQQITKIIKNCTEYHTVFKEFPVEVDFEKTMIIMHCFTTASGSKYEIKSISVDEQTLIIKYKHPALRGRTTPNASKPLAKWVIVVMDKLDIETAEFVFGN